MPSDSNVYLRVKLGPKGEAEIGTQCASVDILDMDRGTDEATIVMDDQAGANTDAIREGAEVRIEMGWESEHALMFVGQIHRVESTARSGGIGRLRFVARDFSQRLNVRPETPGAEHVGTLKDILTTIATRVQLEMGDVLVDPMPSWSEDNKLNQGTKTAWEMIQTLAEENRARAYVEVISLPTDSEAQRQAGGVPRLYFVSEAAMLAQKPLGRMTMCHGFGSLIEFKFDQVGSGASPSADVTTVDPTSGEIVQAAGPPAAPAAPAALSGGQTDQLRGTLGDGRARGAEAAVAQAQAAPVQPADVRARTRVSGAPSVGAPGTQRLIEQDRTRLMGLRGNGLAMGTVFMRAKASVDIDGPSSASTGRWYIRRVNHIVEQSRPTGAEANTRLIRKTYRTKFEATR